MRHAYSFITAHARHNPHGGLCLHTGPGPKHEHHRVLVAALVEHWLQEYHQQIVRYRAGSSGRWRSRRSCLTTAQIPLTSLAMACCLLSTSSDRTNRATHPSSSRCFQCWQLATHLTHTSNLTRARSVVYCVTYGATEEVDHLISQGGSLELRTEKESWTSLFVAVSHGNLDVYATYRPGPIASRSAGLTPKCSPCCTW